jgi:hypothetical protein
MNPAIRNCRVGREVVWLIGQGKRVSDSPQQDFHETIGRGIMLSPTDDWHPVTADYAALFRERSEVKLREAREAIRKARDQAVDNPNTLIPIELPMLKAALGEAHLEERNAAGVVVDDLHYRYFLLSRTYSQTDEYIDDATADSYAEVAFEGMPLWGSVLLDEVMLDDLEGYNDLNYYCYAAELDQ